MKGIKPCSDFITEWNITPNEQAHLYDFLLFIRFKKLFSQLNK